MACRRVTVSLFDSGKRISIEAMDRIIDNKGGTRHKHTGRQIILDETTCGEHEISNSNLYVIVPTGDLWSKVTAVLPQIFATCQNEKEAEKNKEIKKS